MPLLLLPGDGAVPIPLPLYLLGLDIQERWTFAVDITPARDLFMVRSPGQPAAASSWQTGQCAFSATSTPAGCVHSGLDAAAAASTHTVQLFLENFG